MSRPQTAQEWRDDEIAALRKERDCLVREQHAIADELTRQWLAYVGGIHATLARLPQDPGDRLRALEQLRALRARMQSRLAGAA